MEDDNLKNTVRDWFLILAFLLMLLCGCSSSRKVVSDRETKDSVVYTYKIIYQDSLRVKDSTILIYETVQRDSVVLRVDKATDEVLSTDTWHWKDTNKGRDHVSEVKNKTEKSDSVGTKAKSSVVVSKKEIPINLAKKTHYGRTFVIGVAVGIGLSLLFRYRKILIKAIRLI
jgi:uncharacterized protein YcfL